MFGFELEFLRILESNRTSFLNLMFKLITYLGEGTVLFAVILVVYYFFNKKLGQRLIFTFGASYCMNGVIKNFAKVERPFSDSRIDKISCVYPDSATGYSFPSGHSQIMATYSFSLANEFKKWWGFVIASVLSLLVAFSRLYLGAHFPSDVIVGLLLGVAFAFLCQILLEKIGFIKSYIIFIALYLPFIIYFLFENNALFKDFYTGYAFLLAGFFAYIMDKKYVSKEGSTPMEKDAWWRKLLRIVIAAALSFAFKEGLKAVFNLFTVPNWVGCIFDFIRYFALVFVAIGVCPIVFKKIKL